MINKKKSDLLQASAASNYELKTQAVPNVTTTSINNQQQSNPETIQKEKAYGAQMSSLKIESQLSGSGTQQTTSFAKQLKIQQMYSDQASQAIQGHLSHGGAASQGPVGVMAVDQPNQAMNWERPENVTSVTVAHQILQSRQQQISTVGSQVAGVFGPRDPHLNKKHIGNSVFTQQKEVAQPEKGGPSEVSSAFNPMRSRSPHNQNFRKFGNQQQSHKTGSTNQPSALVQGVSLALKAHPISDSRRQQTNIGQTTGAAATASGRGSGYQGASLWGNTNMMDTVSSQQRAAGKASGLTYMQNEHGLIEQSNRDPWKSDWQQIDEKTNSSGPHTQHSNIFSQAGKQRLQAMQSTFGASREGFMVAQPSGVPVRGQYAPFMGTGAVQFGNLGTEGEAHTTSTIFKSSVNSSSGAAEGNYSTKYRHSLDAQQPTPKVISNKGNTNAKRIQTRLNKGKQSLMQEGLQVMGFSRKPGEQSLQTTTGSFAMASLAGEQSEDLMEMTPDTVKEKKKQRIVIGNVTGKSSAGSVFQSNSNDQNIQQIQSSSRRAESLAKQPAGLEGLMHVKNWTQRQQDALAVNKVKTSRHHNSYQHGMRHLQNQSLKQAQASSGPTSQTNDSGHGSGGNIATCSLPSAIGNDTGLKHLNQTTLSSEPDNQKYQIKNQVMKSQKPSKRRQQVASTGGNNHLISVHPLVLVPNNKPRVLPGTQLSPAPNRRKIESHLNQEVTEISGGVKRMKMLHQEFEKQNSDTKQLVPPRTPISGRKKSKKVVLHCETLSGSTNNPNVAGIKTEHFVVKPEEAATEESVVKKHSVKHRQLKNMIRQNKLLNAHPISSFGSQEREEGHCTTSEEEDDDDDMFTREEVQLRPDPHALQNLQKHIHASRDSSLEDTLSREEVDLTGANAMAILQQITPSGLATSSQVQQDSSSYQRKQEQQQDSTPNEFTLQEEAKCEPSKDLDKNSNNKDSLPQIKKEKMQPIQSKARLSMELQRERALDMVNLPIMNQFDQSESFSKHQSSSDSSFQQAFERLIRESSGLKWQLEEILLNRLTIADPVYSEFVDRIMAKNKERQHKIFANSMPAQRKKEDFFENKITQERIVLHIEHEKMRRSEKIYRPFHSDMSRSRFLSNSLREDHPSITSPNLSGTARGSHLHRMQLHFRRHERKRRLHRYLSLNNGVTYHRSAQQASVMLPELSGGLFRSSFGQFGGRLYGISDSLSQRFHPAANDSNSSQKVTPIQQDNKKVADLQDATNRVQIVNAPPGADTIEATVSSAAAPVTSLSKVGKAIGNSNLQAIYEKLNMNDRKAQQFKAFLPLMKQQALKQENNFFRSETEGGAAGENIRQELTEEDKASYGSVAASKRIYGKNIEWQMGKILGQGTTGEVYEALNIDTGETFAVKMIQLMHPYLGLDQQKVKSVKKEINRYKQLNHKHIVKYYDSEIIENNVLCIYLQYMYKSVAQMCQEYGRGLGEKNARMYTYQVLSALAYLHKNNFVHGDLKGGNVLCSQNGKEIKLCDMGNSCLLKVSQQPGADLSASLNSVNSLVNSSPAWMAPETHQSKVGKRSDVWSLGCLIIEMLTGQNPWGQRLDGESNVHMALQRKLANMERPEIPDFVSEDCRNFINSCLQYDRSKRPHATELLVHPWIKNKEHSMALSPKRAAGHN